MNIVHAEYNKYHNIIDINYYNGYILRIDCGKAEDGLITTPNLIIPELSEPPVRTLGATIPENESHIFR